MTLRGTVKKGKIVLDTPAKLPDGTAVTVRALRKKATKKEEKETEGQATKPFGPIAANHRSGEESSVRYVRQS